MSKTLKRPDVFEFYDHHVYVADFFHFRRESQKTFSYTFCARKMGVSSGYLKNLFTRRRSLSLDLIPRFSKTFGLSDIESRYLTMLVVRDAVSEAEMRKYLDGILSTLRARTKEFDSDDFFQSDTSTEHVLKDGLLHLLLSLIKFKDFSPDLDWIRSKVSPALKLSDQEIRSGFKRLIAEKFIEVIDGQYRILNECLSSPDPYDPESFKIYRTGLRQVDHALEKISDYKSCNFFMANLTIDALLERQALDIFNRCRDELLALEKKSSAPARVLAVSNNLITLAR